MRISSWREYLRSRCGESGCRADAEPGALTPQSAKPKSGRETVVIKGEGGSVETIHTGPEVKAPE